jgi:hypothetical protein
MGASRHVIILYLCVYKLASLWAILFKGLYPLNSLHNKHNGQTTSVIAYQHDIICWHSVKVHETNSDIFKGSKLPSSGLTSIGIYTV